MYLQKNYALSVFHDLDSRISYQSLKHYLTEHGWKLCYYDCSQLLPNCNGSSYQGLEISIGNQIIQVAKIENYARSVPSFTYLSQENRAVFINCQGRPSDTKINHFLSHEIGHIVNGHEPIDCILAKGDRRQEKEAKQFSRYLWQLQKNQFLSEWLFFHKIAATMLVCCILFLCCFCGVKSSQFFLYRPIQPSSLSQPASVDSSTSSSAPPFSSFTSPDTSSNADSYRPDDSTLVYVAKTGTVYHLYVDCSYIKGRDGIIEMPAAYIGDKSLCTRCKQRYFCE